MSSRRTCGLILIPTLPVLFSLLTTTAAVRAQQQPTPISQENKTEVCIATFEEAQLKQKRGKLVFARKLFNECAAETCPRQLREDCARHRDDIERAVPSVVLVVRDASGKDVAASLKVDGQPFVAEAGRATPIDPGVHDVEVKIEGRASPTTSKITIYEGEKSRVIVLPSSPPSSPASDAKGNAPAPSSSTGSSADGDAPKRGVPVGAIVVGGLGVLSLLAGGGMFVLASNEADERDKSRRAAGAIGDPPVGSTAMQEKRNLNTAADSHNDAARQNKMLGFVFGGAGLLLVIGGVVWLVVDRSNASAGTTTKKGSLSPPSPSFVPILTPTTAGASWVATF